MQPISTPVVRELVLVGGGHSHVTVLRRFGMAKLPGVRLTVITRDVHTPYSGMLPGFIAGHYDFDEVHIDLRPLANFAGARLYHDEVIGIDLEARQLRCRHRPPVPYDVVSINIGSTPFLGGIPGATERAVPVKPVSNFVARWRQLVERVRTSDRPRRIGVVGAGAGGIELLLAADHALRSRGPSRNTSGVGEETGGSDGPVPVFELFSASAQILPSHNRGVRRRLRRVLEKRGIRVHLNRRVRAVEEGRLLCEDGSEHEVDEVLWVTEAGAARWLRDSALETDDGGFIRVHPTLQSTSNPEVFAAGDVASVDGYPREKAGVFAVRQGKPLDGNLRRALLGETLRPFRPQKKFLSLISTGDQYAIASRGRWSAEGRALWRWKDAIDRRFMNRFSALPEMPQPAPPELPRGLGDDQLRRELATASMRCAGCGAKVGSTVLSRVLARLDAPSREDVLVGLEAPDDAAVLAPPPGKVLVQTVDAFPAMVDDPYLFGKIAANHSLGDIFAMGAEPASALAIAGLPFGPERQVEETLTQLMLGALEVLKEAGATLAGGHTAESHVLSLGFAVSGWALRERILEKRGLGAGDRLILTKPIGTGALFAADMRRRAKGRWISGALAVMLESNQQAAACFERHGATACTDVTGFGVIGHLLEMARPSKTQVRLELSRVPLLDGALECAATGIHSSLYPQNLQASAQVLLDSKLAQAPALALLYDPQTAGGLLAGVPEERAEACCAELRESGAVDAAIIGCVEPRDSDGLLLHVAP